LGLLALKGQNLAVLLGSILDFFVINGEPNGETRTLSGFSFAGNGYVAIVAVGDFVTNRQA
jgi:hypothetical protein